MFWVGLLVAVVSAFFIPSPPNVKTGAQISGFVAFMMLGTAYFTSPYLKLNGKIYAAYKTDVQADDPVSDTDAPSPRGDAADDGLLTSARKLWWFMVPGMALCTFNVGQYVFAREEPRLAAVMAAVMVLVSVVFGFVDGRAGNPIARRQTAQFVLITVVTVGIFAILYLSAYGMCQRKPLRDDPGAR